MKYYSTNKACKLLSLSRPTIYKICKAKNIEIEKTIGGSYRFSEIDLKRIIESRENTESVERRFSNMIEDVMIMLNAMAKEIYGEEAEQKLKDLIMNNKQEIFILK
jgi:excisionase family DNA binding protein